MDSSRTAPQRDPAETDPTRPDTPKADPGGAQHALLREIAAERRELRRDVALTALTGVALAVGVALQLAGPPAGAEGSVPLAFAVAYAAGGIPAALGALSELRRGTLDIDLLMVLAALAAAAVGEPRDGAILLFLFSLAGTLEAFAMGNTKRAVASLMQLKPDTARRRDPVSGQLATVPADALEPGDVVQLRPGERVPADAVVVDGASALDQSSITGESVPADKEPGDAVFAGTVNGHGSLELRVVKRATESTLARMIELVTEARTQRSPSQRFSDWFGQRYTVLVLLGSAAALLAFLALGMARDVAFYKAATLLVVASPCAIVISVPAAVLSALAAAARRGVLFKGGAALEDFGAARVMAFDKTGTLTQGRMRVAEVVALGDGGVEGGTGGGVDGGAGGGEDALLATAAALEEASEHPIAAAIVAEARRRGLAPAPLGTVRAVPGMGVREATGNGTGNGAGPGGEALWAGNLRMAEAERALPDAGHPAGRALERLGSEGRTAVLVGRGRRLLGVIGVADAVRPSAARALAELRALGLRKLVMLTGDTPEVARAVARDLGFAPEHTHAALLPQDKLELVRVYSRDAEVAYVGDGVNDAAALAAARVGVAMGVMGSDVALETADVALLSDDLTRLPDAYRLAQRANRVIRQNLAFALGIMALMVLLTLFWHLPLPLGVLGHEGGTLLVVGNGLRLLLGGRRAPSAGGGRTAAAPA